MHLVQPRGSSAPHGWQCGFSTLGAVLAAGAIFVVLTAASPALAARDAADPRVARVAFVEGETSYLNADADEWTPVDVNAPLVTGDRFYAGADGRAEIELPGGVDARTLERDRARSPGRLVGGGPAPAGPGHRDVPRAQRSRRAARRDLHTRPPPWSRGRAASTASMSRRTARRRCWSVRVKPMRLPATSATASSRGAVRASPAAPTPRAAARRRSRCSTPARSRPTRGTSGSRNVRRAS